METLPRCVKVSASTCTCGMVSKNRVWRRVLNRTCPEHGRLRSVPLEEVPPVGMPKPNRGVTIDITNTNPFQEAGAPSTRLPTPTRRGVPQERVSARDLLSLFVPNTEPKK